MAPGGRISIQVVHVMFTVISTGYYAFLSEPGLEFNPRTAKEQKIKIMTCHDYFEFVYFSMQFSSVFDVVTTNPLDFKTQK